MTAVGDVRRRRIDELAARAGQLPAGAGGVSLVRSAFRRLRRDPVAIIGAVIVVVFLVVAAFAPLLAPRDPLAQSLLSQIRPGEPVPSSGGGHPRKIEAPMWQSAQAQPLERNYGGPRTSSPQGRRTVKLRPPQ